MISADNLNSEWRKVASTIYSKPVDSKIFGHAELDVTDLEEFISKKRKSGLKITLTHIFTLMVARCLKSETPELNVYLRRGKIVSRSTIDAMVSVLQADGGMGSVKVENADQINLEQLESLLREEIQNIRQGDEKGAIAKKHILSKIPWPFRKWLFGFYKTFTIKWGFSLPGLGLKATSFGSFILTNIGSIGIDTGYPALLPSSNIAFVIVMGGVQKKPVVVNDEIVIRRMISLSIVIDHRVADASHGGKMLRFLKHAVRNPEDYV